MFGLSSFLECQVVPGLWDEVRTSGGDLHSGIRPHSGRSDLLRNVIPTLGMGSARSETCTARIVRVRRHAMVDGLPSGGIAGGVAGAHAERNLHVHEASV